MGGVSLVCVAETTLVAADFTVPGAAGLPTDS